MRAGVLARRALNQYRRRDVFPYLSLRYYLDAVAARTDDWVRSSAVDMLLRRPQPAYLTSLHFKEVENNGAIRHRSLFLPTANESLVEALLVAKCATLWKVQRPEGDRSYSYIPSVGDDDRGIFRPYVEGLRSRQAMIAGACRAAPNGIVAFCDIKRFYPSISLTLAQAVWADIAKSAALETVLISAGHRMLSDHGASGDGGNLLTGPMLSHLVADAVLKKVDWSRVGQRGQVAYFRYVDDVTLVGRAADVARARRALSEQLEQLGLELHGDDSEKSAHVPCDEWLTAERDYTDNDLSLGWMRLIGNIKRLALLRPNQVEELRRGLRSLDCRIPVRSYAAASRERGFVQRAVWWWQKNVDLRARRELSVASILREADRVRAAARSKFNELLDATMESRGFARRRRVPGLRYCLGRLTYLSTRSDLIELAGRAQRIPELYLHAQVANAVGTSDVTRVVQLGQNAAQAAAQPLREAGIGARCSARSTEPAVAHGLAVLAAYGVRVDAIDSELPNPTPLQRFANGPVERALFRSSDRFVANAACLHGIGDKVRHHEVLQDAFDVDENGVFDAIEQAESSGSL